MMDDFELFSQRQKRARGEVKDVFDYDSLPHKLRVQMSLAIEMFLTEWSNSLGSFNRQHSSKYYVLVTNEIVSLMRQTVGRFYLDDGLINTNSRTPTEEIKNFLLHEKDVSHVIDLLESVILVLVRYVYGDRESEIDYDNCVVTGLIRELNRRFLEHAIGYQIVQGCAVRMDSNYTHKEVILPSVALLRSPEFKGSEQEFQSALEHHRHGRVKESIVDSLKAFESTMKAICSKRGWAVQENPQAKHLIKACIDNGLFPRFHDGHLTSLRTLLESCVPTVRNKLGGHGQGSEVLEVDAHLAAFALHSTSAAIILLVESEKALSQDP